MTSTPLEVAEAIQSAITNHRPMEIYSNGNHIKISWRTFIETAMEGIEYHENADAHTVFEGAQYEENDEGIAAPGCQECANIANEEAYAEE